ncbi:MAG TPA: hypothetical protein VI316_10230 [Candidatus Dormibacteraeota bacterium]
MDLNELSPLSVDPAWYDAPETWHSFVGAIDLSTARADEVELWGELGALMAAAGAAPASPKAAVPVAGI